MLMILARLVRSESFWAVAKVRSPHTGPGIRYIITVLQSSEGPARSTAELAVVAVVVGTKAHLSAIHRRSFPSLKAGYTVDAHIEALVDERDVASSFVPGHCSRRKAPYTAKYISLHLSYRRPGVQPPPVRLSSTLAPAK